MKSFVSCFKMIARFGLILLLFAAISSIPVQAARNSAKSKGEPQRFVTIDFNNVDINVFIKFISELTGKNFVIDQRVKGNVTIISPTKISIKEAYRVFESVLEVHGFSAVKAGKVTKIIPATDARSKNIETKLRAEVASPQDRLVTQLMPLRYADPTEIKRLFTPLVSKSSVIVDYRPTNMLIITDIYSNIQRLMKILDAIDLPGIGREITVVPLEYADATKMVSILDTVFQPRKKGKKAVQQEKAKFVADERTNAVILLASEDDTFRIRQLIRMLDKETPRGKEKIRVYYLENATAEELAKVLSELPTKQGGTPKGKGAPALSEDLRITADKATNSLIISAASDDYVVIEEIIKQLDIPRSMVYIEALIMEVRVGKDFRLGTEWRAVGDASIGNRDAAYGGGFVNQPEQSVLPSLALGVPPSGFSLGVFTEAIDIAGVQFNNLTAVINAFQDDEDINILSTPQILTTDNEEAKINVGENIPYQTTISTNDSGDTFNSFEYRDVGTTLTITPHINKDRLVRLSISLELKRVSSTSLDLQPTTLTRTVDTTAIVKDTNTIVIGGLIGDQSTASEFKVPLLGDIPILGWLFKSRSTKKLKTNLFVFLTPRVVQTPAEAADIYGQKKEQIDKFREGQIKMYKKKKAKPESES